MEAVRMRAPNGKRFWARPGRIPWRSVVDAVVGCVMAAGLLIVAAAVPAPAPVAELFAALAVVIVIGTTDQLPAAIRALRPASKAANSDAVAELRSELAKLPETRHPLGL
jgi:hypothetical protein